jgi:hypothetical protein
VLFFEAPLFGRLTSEKREFAQSKRVLGSPVERTVNHIGLSWLESVDLI